METRPQISVITPTKNRVTLLSEAIDSVRAQEFEDWEHIIVDDGSDACTIGRVEELIDGDPRIRFFRREGGRSGPNVCRNEGVKAARADLVVFLDSDDLLAPDCLERRVRTMNRNLDLDFAVFVTDAFRERPGDLTRSVNGDILGDDLLGFLFFELPWVTASPIWRRKALGNLGGFDETLPSWQDVDLHVRAVAGGMRYLKFPWTDCHMRWQQDPAKVSTLQRRDPNHLAAAEELIEKFETVVRQGPGMNWVRQRALCSLYFFVAERWIEIGKTAEAMECWRRIRRRGLGQRVLYSVGGALLLLSAPRSPVGKLGRRLTHKWKGWARLRSNPELVRS